MCVRLGAERSADRQQGRYLVTCYRGLRVQSKLVLNALLLPHAVRRLHQFGIPARMCVRGPCVDLYMDVQVTSLRLRRVGRRGCKKLMNGFDLAHALAKFFEKYLWVWSEIFGENKFTRDAQSCSVEDLGW